MMVAASSAKESLSKGVYKEGEEIEVTLSGGLGSALDWIGIL